MSPSPAKLFVYGTLLPGDVRWHLLEPFVVDDGWPDTAPGRLYDTGLGYPAAVFGRSTDGPVADDAVDAAGERVVAGRTMPLLESSLGRALAVLDEVEGTVAGLYERIVVRTGRGHDAWAYRYGGGLELTPIDSGDWTTHH